MASLSEMFFKSSTLKYLAVCLTLSLASIEARVLDSQDIAKRIVNGNDAAPGFHPYQVSLQYYVDGTWEHFCGGTLISRDRVLTAAHCLGHLPNGNYRIIAGTTNTEDPDETSQVVAVANISIHEEYVASKSLLWPNDIAVLSLAEPVVFNCHVKKAVLAPAGKNFKGVTCTTSGWGLVNNRVASVRLQEVNVTSISNRKCELLADERIYDTQICAYDPGYNPPSTCRGDSGGPLMCNNYLAGVTSFGESLCEGFYPSVFTRVSEYRDWIRQHMDEEEVCSCPKTT